MRPRRTNSTSIARRLTVRAAFTLVELMVVLVIISILASVIMFAMFGAQEAAREAKTKNMISKLNTAIMQRYESYITRRVPLRMASNEQPMNFARRRLQAIRELMRMEMPDRWTDVFDAPVTGIAVPSVTRTYRRIVNLRHSTAASQNADAFQGAESLFLIVSYGTEDADAMTHFSQSDIGDVDNDGLPEFLDGWGRPISFIRWPAGFDSPRQSRDETKDFDQFNPWRILDDRPPTAQPPWPSNVPRRFALYPLIYSGGPDKKYDIATGAEDSSGTAVPVRYSVPAGSTSAYVDPYMLLPNSNMQVGQPNDNDSDGSLDNTDNVHNHNLIVR